MSSTLRSVLAALLLLAALTACSADEPESAPPPVDAARAIDRALDARARAVRRVDADAFTRQVAGSPEFRDLQQAWFANLTQLPVARLSYRVDPGSVVRRGGTWTATVETTLRLEGYDAAPVASQGRYRFRAAAARPRRFVLTGIEERSPQPWDLGPVDVREGSGVLGVFDAGSVAAAPELVVSVESGLAAVAAEVPYQWSRSVVLYALSEPAFLEGLDDVPGDDPGDLDAVAFPVGRGTRFALNPRMLGQPGRERDRLVRHELTHVAIGTRDDAVPVWLSEGLAEYVAVRPLAPRDRRIPEASVRAARAGATELPDDETFNDQDSDAHYGLAWWAVEWIADTYGDDAPWTLLDAMAVPGADPDAVLRERLGTSTAELARQADRLILGLYEPAG
ncbi:hypothetical protein GCM10027062_39170 [Nocardioides hungaricus]